MTRVSFSGIFDCVKRTWTLYSDNPRKNDPLRRKQPNQSSRLGYLTSGRVLESSSQHASLYRRTSFMYTDHASCAFPSSSFTSRTFCTMPVLSTLPPRRLPKAGPAGFLAPAAVSSCAFCCCCCSCIFLNISRKEPSFLNTLSLDGSSSSSSSSSSILMSTSLTSASAAGASAGRAPAGDFLACLGRALRGLEALRERERECLEAERRRPRCRRRPCRWPGERELLREELCRRRWRRRERDLERRCDRLCERLLRRCLPRDRLRDLDLYLPRSNSTYSAAFTYGSMGRPAPVVEPSLLLEQFDSSSSSVPGGGGLFHMRAADDGFI
ncbi:hypothetical protein NQ318_004292 [Aromia moschata]|uniref:Uncharacterized protein n=1 Tax=Aromia moschata TaxID=1265417 RepID=A0AAV8YRK2_9CUCU|nr:hypothetical protein NQ318_004292 [Aromia moschata]